MKNVIEAKNFLRATRDSGYRNLGYALAELVDNSIEAGSKSIEIKLPRDEFLRGCWEISVRDDGRGMDEGVLAHCLQFGGSSRFNSREGIGRFGMGLPNSSLSHARRTEVYSWQSQGPALMVSLDLDELLQGASPFKRQPIRATCPEAENKVKTTSGTVVRWLRLDRSTPRSWALERKRVISCLGRLYRHAIEDGLKITVDGKPVNSVDPLHLSGAEEPLACAFGEPLQINVSNLLGGDAAPVIVRFSFLNVSKLASLSTQQKRAFGIVGGAGVSIIRAGREIDYRWVFIAKRKENYDEWWRCELSFEPELDELFGVTNTKQGIRPSEGLKAALTPTLTSIARQLNALTRQEHTILAGGRVSPAEQAIARAVQVLGVARSVQKPSAFSTATTLQLSSAKLAAATLMGTDTADGKVSVILNENHPFHRVFYKPLVEGALSPDEVVRAVDLLILAIGHQRCGLSADFDGLVRRYFGGGKSRSNQAAG